MFDLHKRLRFATLPLAMAIGLVVAPVVYADETVVSSGNDTITFTPTVEHVADGNIFLDYTFVENFVGIAVGTRVGTGEFVIHPDGMLNTQNDGIFTGTIAGRSGTGVMQFWGSGTFASVAGSFNFEQGTDGLAGVHAVGKVVGSATGPTSFAGADSIKVNFSAP